MIGPRGIQALGMAALLIASTGVVADDWPQWLGPQRDGVLREKGIVEKIPSEGLKQLWTADVGMGYSGPAVAQGIVVVTDRILAEGAKNPANPFAKDKVAGKERVLVFSATEGKLLWKHEYECAYEMSYPAGPRTTPIITKDRIYTLGAMGDLLCLDSGTQKVVWSKNFMNDYNARVQAWGFSASPLLDGDKLICLVGGKDSLVVAFHKDTGKELWRALAGNQQGYCPPVIYTIAGKRQLIVWDPSALHGLNPEDGKEIWSQDFKVRSDLTVSMPRLDGNRLLITSFYNGSMLLDVSNPEPKVVWKGKGRGELPDATDGLHSIMPTPYLRDGHIYGVCSHAEVRCLKADTGERVWESLEATTKRNEKIRWANAFLIPVEGTDRCFLFNELGDLILAKLTPKGYEELGRTHLVDPTNTMASFGIGRSPAFPVVWSHPAFANQCVFARSDKKLVCVSLKVDGK